MALLEDIKITVKEIINNFDMSVDGSGVNVVLATLCLAVMLHVPVLAVLSQTILFVFLLLALIGFIAMYKTVSTDIYVQTTIAAMKTDPKSIKANICLNYISMGALLIGGAYFLVFLAILVHVMSKSVQKKYGEAKKREEELLERSES